MANWLSLTSFYDFISFFLLHMHFMSVFPGCEKLSRGKIRTFNLATSFPPSVQSCSWRWQRSEPRPPLKTSKRASAAAWLSSSWASAKAENIFYGWVKVCHRRDEAALQSAGAEPAAAHSSDLFLGFCRCVTKKNNNNKKKLFVCHQGTTTAAVGAVFSRKLWFIFLLRSITWNQTSLEELGCDQGRQRYLKCLGLPAQRRETVETEPCTFAPTSPSLSQSLLQQGK